VTRLLKFSNPSRDSSLADHGAGQVHVDPSVQPDPRVNKQTKLRNRTQSQAILWSRMMGLQKKRVKKSFLPKHQEQFVPGKLKVLEAELEEFKKRVEYLEQANTLYLDALELAMTFGDFQESINKCQDPQLILSETVARAEKLIDFDVQSIFLMQEEDSNFRLAKCDPQEMTDQVQQEFETLIDEGVMAMAINDKKPVMLASRNNEYQILIHVLATCSRVRGMFVGMIKSEEADIPEVLLSLMSILLNSSANTLESYELYSVIREQKAKLEELLRQRTSELTDLRDEMDIRVQKKLEQMQADLDRAKEEVIVADTALLWFKDHVLMTRSEEDL